MSDRSDLILIKPMKNPKPIIKISKKDQSDPLCSEIPEWLQEFRENLVDHETPAQGVLTPREGLGQNTMFKLISLKTEIARSVNGPKLQRPHAEDAIVGAVLRAENLGDLMTANHQVVTINCESRNKRRHFCCIVCNQSGLNESWWVDSMECYICLRNFTDLLSDGGDALCKTLWETT